MKKKILILCPYPHGQAPSQRFRFEQYIGFLKNSGVSITQKSFLDEDTWHILYKPGNGLKKGWGIIKGFVNRFLLLFTIFNYDFVFIHREATPVGAPIVEWLIAKVFRKKIIYDFDDAIWLNNTSQENKIAAALKCNLKVRWVCKWSYKVSCGNDYLAAYARQFNQNVEIVPTTIDTDYHRSREIRNKKQETIVLGWTGTHSTEKYLSQLVPVLKELEKTFSFIFRVISNHNPQLPLKSFQFKAWDKDTEIDDLLRFDIGVMPLEDNEWAKGKCGFKGLQYMALSIPTIMSPVGVNNQIIDHGENGYLAQNDLEWRNILIQLLADSSLRQRIGEEGRKKVIEYFSVKSQQSVYLDFFADSAESVR